MLLPLVVWGKTLETHIKKTFPGLLQRLFGFHLGGYCRNTVTCAKRFQLKGYMCDDYELSCKTLHIVAEVCLTMKRTQEIKCQIK